MTTRPIRRTALAITPLVGTGLVLLTGCSSNSAHAFRSNPTTQMDARGQTTDEVANTLAITTDTNYRNINNDLGRLFFSDHPSRLTNGPKPY